MSDLCYSTDGECFQFTSFGDLLDAMASDDELTEGQVYFEADCEMLTTEYMVDDSAIYTLLERLDEDLYEEVGEAAGNDYTNAKPEARAELLALVRGWADKHTSVTHYWRIIGKTREKRLTAADVESGDV
jgi:hypothetical protein